MGFFSWLSSLNKQGVGSAESPSTTRGPDDRYSEPKIPELVSIFTDGGALKNGSKNCKASWSFVVPFPPASELVLQTLHVTDMAWGANWKFDYQKVASDTRPKKVRMFSSNPREYDVAEAQQFPVPKDVPITYRNGLLEVIDAGEWQTNNKAELMAIIKALEWANFLGIKRVKIYSDSQYAIYCINQHVTGWQRKANQRYFAQIDDLAKLFDLVDFAWIAGHQENDEGLEAKCNEFADGLCREALGIPKSYRPKYNQEGMERNRGGFKPNPRSRGHRRPFNFRKRPN